MTDHRERIDRINAKMSYIESEGKAKWYRRDEQSLDSYERELDGQIRKIRRRKGESGEIPAGIRAAEKGR